MVPEKRSPWWHAWLFWPLRRVCLVLKIIYLPVTVSAGEIKKR